MCSLFMWSILKMLKSALFLDAMNYLLAQEMESERTWNEYERQKQRTLMNSKRQ